MQDIKWDKHDHSIQSKDHKNTYTGGMMHLSKVLANTTYKLAILSLTDEA